MAGVNNDLFSYLLALFRLFIAFEMDVVEILIDRGVNALVPVRFFCFARLDQLEVVVEVYGARLTEGDTALLVRKQ